MPKPKKQSLFWKISGNGLMKESYLFGTIHIYDTAVFQIPRKVFNALKKADTFWAELDLNEMPSGISYSNVFHSNAEKTLDKLLGKRDFGKLMQYSVFKNFGEEKAKQISPLFAYTLLFSEQETETTSSVDKELFDFARKREKETFGLETLEDQLTLLNSSSKGQVKMLKTFLSKKETVKEGFDEMLQYYKNQDFESLNENLKDSFSSSFLPKKFLDKRNRKAVNKIVQYIVEQEKSAFIAVGAMHLHDTAFSQGMVSLLEEKGFSLKPLKLVL